MESTLRHGSRRQGAPGFGLVELLVALGLVGIVLMIVVGAFGKGLSAQRTLDQRASLEDIRRLIYSAIDCPATFAAAGIDPASPGSRCNSTSATGGQTGPYLALRRRTGDGSVQWLTGPALTGGAAAIAGWSVRASCSASEQSLVVRAARLAPGGGFAKDPLSGRLLDWAARRSLLFGVGPSALPLCFNPPPRCQTVQASAGTLAVGNTIAASCPSGYAAASCTITYFASSGGYNYTGTESATLGADGATCSYTRLVGQSRNTFGLNLECCE